eukprot:TRINITY_DN120716_c0_g1_i1.p1 TRINITY_DN120716_c0_g1~~TRINITY_DN120716_c0_g1_i1.p1  ORF type:complete len:614 (+),score=123.85 TRINITY_DN120716_c0_g1_i1:75-1916(+)
MRRFADVAAYLAVTVQQHDWLGVSASAPELVITNEPDDPETHQFFDNFKNPITWWPGNYHDPVEVSCIHTTDMLFDWAALKQAVSSWLREMTLGGDRIKQVYWEKIRPMQHAFTNVIAYHNYTENTPCFVGTLAIRYFYLVSQSQDYREREFIGRNAFALDWAYLVRKFKWSTIVKSGWGDVIWPSLHHISRSFRDFDPWLQWEDCPGLPHEPDIQLPRSLEEAVSWLTDGAEFFRLADAVERADVKTHGRVCPAALGYACILVAFGVSSDAQSLKYLDRAQKFLQQYSEKNDFTMVNLANVKWPLWEVLSQTILNLEQGPKGLIINPGRNCTLTHCPDGGTPVPASCSCEVLFPKRPRDVSVCIFMSDTRRTSSLRNITSVINARYWTLAFGLNRLYAEDHGYEIHYTIPDPELHYPERKVGWGKVKVMIDRMREYGPERCEYGVSIDTDAFIRSSEPLSGVIHEYGLDKDKLMLFSQEYHTEVRDNIYANGGFFIVRNTKEGVGLLEEWYNVPEKYEEMRHLKKENPQGLNLCWDEKMQPRYSDKVVLAPPQLFTAPMGWFVRHNWFKEKSFEQEMIEILLQKLNKKYGCIFCDNVYDWDNSVNHDVGPQR